MDNDLKLSEVSNEVHDLSKVFTGAVYDVLADAFTASRHPRTRDDAEVLYDVGSRMASLMIQAFEAAPANDASFAEVAEAMMDIANSDPDLYPNYATFVENQFRLREVIGPGAAAGPMAVMGFAPSLQGCCGTMQSLEYQGERGD